MISRDDLCQYLTEYLKPHLFSDYCPNGLQVEGRASIGRLVTGVTASVQLLQEAIKFNADAVLVHHGYFWKRDPSVIVGVHKRRVAELLSHDINLLAYHLPLDAHDEVGNNVMLGRELGFVHAEPLSGAEPPGLLWRGQLKEAQPLDEFSRHVARVLNRVPLCIAGGKHSIRSIAWCTGAAQGLLEQASGVGVDAYLSGEISEPTVHLARELGIHYIAAGHHATERYGVSALGEHLAKRFGMTHQFVDIDNPA